MRIGILGGSGVYNLEGLTGVERRELRTPFGDPSDSFVCGELDGREVTFLARHGQGHRLLPSEINHRANIYGFKLLGVERVVSITAVGSLRENLRPRDIVLPDQYFDRTKRSAEHTFFGNGVVAHVSFAEPTCGDLRKWVAASAAAVIKGKPGEFQPRLNEGGVYVNMEGPAFSTKAESHYYRRQGFDVIGMTSLAEAKLCREAEICYQALAMVTDYDCWHETEEAVTVEMLIGHLNANTRLAGDTLRELMRRLPEARSCDCGQAVRSAIITRPEVIPARTREALAPIIGKYV